LTLTLFPVIPTVPLYHPEELRDLFLTTLHRPFNSPQRIEQIMAKQQIDAAFSNILHVLKTIFPLTIGMFIGVLGGVSLSYIDDKAKVSNHPKPFLQSRPSVRHPDTSSSNNSLIYPPVIQEKSSSSVMNRKKLHN